MTWNIEINHNMQLHEPSAGNDLIDFEPSLYKNEKAKGVVKARVAQVDASGSQMESGSDLHEDHETGQSESEQPAGAKDGNTLKRCKRRRRESRVISLPIAIGSSDIGSQVNSTLKKAMSKMVRRQQANQSQQAKEFEQRPARLEEEFEQRVTQLEEEFKTKQVSKAHFEERMRAMETALSQRITEHLSRMARERETDHSTHTCEYSQLKGECKQVHEQHKTLNVRIDSVRSEIQDSGNRVTRLVQSQREQAMSRSLTEVASVRCEITSLDQSLGGIRTGVTGLEGAEKELQRRLTEMGEGIEMVGGGFSHSEANVVSLLAHQGQDDMSKRIGMIQNSLTAQLKECMAVKLAVDVHSKRFTSLDKRLRVNEQRFQDCPLHLQALEARLRELGTNRVLHGDRLCSFDERLTQSVDGVNTHHFSDNFQKFFEQISALESCSLDAQSLKL